jgi:hypothetical protein
MFNRCDLPLDGSALLDDVIVSELAARRPAPITDSAVALLATLVAAVDSRPIPDSPNVYEEIHRLRVCEPIPMTSAPIASQPPPTTGPIVIKRTWDGPRHRRNRPARRRVTGSVAVISVVASTVSISGMAAAVGGDPLRPFHTVVTRVWDGVAGGTRAADAHQSLDKSAGNHAVTDSTTRVKTQHPQAATVARTRHHHPIHAAVAPSAAGTPSESSVAVAPFTPALPSEGPDPTLADPVHNGGGEPGAVGTVVWPGQPTEPSQPSGPVWTPPVGLPSGTATPPHVHWPPSPQPTFTVHAPSHP